MADTTPLTVIGGGLAGLVTAITSAESGAPVTLHESHRDPGGRARTATGDSPYKTNEGPHALYSRGPLWTWLQQRDLVGPASAVPLSAAARTRFHRDGSLHRMPPLPVMRLGRRDPQQAPVEEDFFSWAAALVGERHARFAANAAGVALFHHDPGILSARFVQERLHRVLAMPPEAKYPVGGWSSVVDGLVGRARSLGVRIETSSRVTPSGLAEAAGRGPVVVATSLAAARTLLGDDSLTWESGRTALLDLGLRARRGDAFIVSDLDAPGWVERFTAQDRTLAPAGEHLVQAQFPIGEGESKAVGIARGERLLDLGMPGWRDRVTYRSEALAAGRTGALDLPGTTWRDRPAIDRGNGIYLAGDQVAAPGLLAEVSFNSALEAASLAMRAPRIRTARPLDLNRA
ncbi:NAD(P)-binding protein [Streptomyces sp. NBC_00237]|uniref:NAD(P)-binding protein n=1 Tax=Streptomyces sp. NBC_00237 TaxID=2975687 RepID=UPI00225C1DC3|nr:NAD(P)-binding protein [Streptomyces sp. NBC_00237]MCX5200410.1 NAD(P)-binding protein [Streptomyces sp. NBC_00237]